MNYVIAQGSPNSLVRHFQDHPTHGVALLAAAKEALAALRETETGTAFLREKLRAAIADVQINLGRLEPLTLSPRRDRST